METYDQFLKGDFDESEVETPDYYTHCSGCKCVLSLVAISYAEDKHYCHTCAKAQPGKKPEAIEYYIEEQDFHRWKELWKQYVNL